MSILSLREMEHGGKITQCPSKNKPGIAKAYSFDSFRIYSFKHHMIPPSDHP